METMLLITDDHYFQACWVLRYQLAGSFGRRGGSLALRRSGGSAISSTGLGFIGRGVVAVAVAVVSIGRVGTSVKRRCGGGEKGLSRFGFPR